jgi:hypothetical protein
MDGIAHVSEVAASLLVEAEPSLARNFRILGDVD